MGFYFLGLSLVNIWQNVQEELQLNTLTYLNAIHLITLCYVSKYFGTRALKKFYKHYDISTGFCAFKYWTNRFEENIFGLSQSIHNIHEAFDDKLVKKFRHMSLFSVCLHFLRCQRSCEKKSGYCKMCSRVKENTFYDYNAFLNLKVSRMDDYLDTSSSERNDLDVFLNRPKLLFL